MDEDSLPPITLHGLRHTWATLALPAGTDIKLVSERLNHSSTTITREIYTHVPHHAQPRRATNRGQMGLRRTMCAREKANDQGFYPGHLVSEGDLNSGNPIVRGCPPVSVVDRYLVRMCSR